MVLTEARVRLAQRVAAFWAYKTVCSLPWQARRYLSVGDIENDIMAVVVERLGTYDQTRASFSTWVSVIGRSCCVSRSTKEWDKVYSPQRKGSVWPTGLEVQDDGSLSVVLLDLATPELLLECFQTASLIEDRLMGKLIVTAAQVDGMCEAVGLDKGTTLNKLLEHALGQMDQDKYDALTEEIRTSLQEWGDAYEKSEISVVAKQPARATKKGVSPEKQKALNKAPAKAAKTKDRDKPKQARGRGVIAKIQELFDGGIVTAGDMIAAMEKTGMDFSPQTVRISVSVFRRRAGISRQRVKAPPQATKAAA